MFTRAGNPQKMICMRGIGGRDFPRFFAAGRIANPDLLDPRRR
jgi:hypothetical protein